MAKVKFTEEDIERVYAEVFQNLETGKVGMDLFSASSEGGAKHDFRECYRHGNYNILSVTLVPDLKNKEG